jgi:hypothetical protein
VCFDFGSTLDRMQSVGERQDFRLRSRGDDGMAADDLVQLVTTWRNSAMNATKQTGI